MNKWILRTGAIVLVAAIALGAVGLASAQGPGGGPGRGPNHGPRFPQRPFFQHFRQMGDPILPKVFDAIEEATGLTQDDVLPLLLDGKTFSEILQEKNIEPQVVIDAVTAVLTEEVNQAVEDGWMTEERAASVLENLPATLDRLMNTPLQDRPIRERLQLRLENSLVGVMAEMAGVEIDDLLAEEFAPPSLAEIAAERGLDPDAIIAETEKRITEEVNAAVADGRMTEENAAVVLDGLHDRLVEHFNAPFMPFHYSMQGGYGFGGGMHQQGGFMGGRWQDRGGRWF
jgi:hypothetical protein